MPDRLKLITLDILSSLLAGLFLYFNSGLIVGPIPVFILMANLTVFAMVIISNLDDLRIHYILGKSKRQQWKSYILSSFVTHLTVVIFLELIFGLLEFMFHLIILASNLLITLVMVSAKAIFLSYFLRRNL